MGDLGSYKSIAHKSTLYVPTSDAVTDYKSTDNWKEFYVGGVYIPTRVEELAVQDVKVVGQSGKLSVMGLKGETVEIYDICGLMVYREQTIHPTIMVELCANAIYIVKVGSLIEKVIL